MACIHPAPHPKLVQSAEGGKGKYKRERIIVGGRSPCQDNYPADAHSGAHKSVLESANPVWTWGVHLDAPGQRHGQQPRLWDGRPPEESNRTSHPGAPFIRPTHFRPHRGSECARARANRRLQRQANQHHGLVPDPPPPLLSGLLYAPGRAPSFW